MNNSIDGIHILGSHHITLDSVEVEGFQKAGLFIDNSNNIQVNRVHAHDNGFAGISAMNVTRLSIEHSFAENNPGDPTNFTNHSGNGIVVGYGRNVLIDHCRATNNGWDMPRVGNGPVGIWAWESDSVRIQFCVSYRNKTSKGGEDGGGFDLDGGVTNSVIENCISFGNDGSGFGLFQYAGANPWKNNVVKSNVSWNDGLVSTAHAGIYIWNSSGDANQLANCEIVDNVIFNKNGSAIRFATESNHTGFLYRNNVFISKQLHVGEPADDTFENNFWRAKFR